MQLFFDFLAGPAHRAGRLTILGDLFDYWAGDDDLADPFNRRIVNALRQLADSGVAVDFMAGNRDFLVGKDFAAAAGTRLIPDPTLRIIEDVPTLLTHGDTLCTDDLDYLQFRAQVRAPAWRSAFLARPLAERKREIEALRSRSETEKLNKPGDIMDANLVAVHDSLLAHQAQAMIHGHTHRQNLHEHVVNEKTSRRWVLGDWHGNRGNALLCEPAAWHWLSVGESA